ncbi:MAG: bifunctional DNA-formamidopyrimidine glycosylase/DNA-(apurinic or apyrimidinic site) lyase [Betaproteobacteria bacterium]|nr:bifunctional DNA-formamidopyrimidine glycosylase/DNA-(apurinic or apyrimidinic site) lyase [Betaproteobacteria bacterium]
MPELPEVETVRTDLENRLAGRRISSMHIYRHRLRRPIPADLPQLVAKRKVRAVRRRAKYLLIDFVNGSMIVHLGMSGSIRADRACDALRKHDHVQWRCSGQLLRYNDPRRFGMIDWSPDQDSSRLLTNCGVEPLSGSFSTEFMYRVTRKRKIAIKALLMDSSLIAGIGNIYACETLFAASIRPSTPAGALNRQQCKAIVAAAKKILKAAIKAGGSTLRDYTFGSEKTGYFQFAHKVYGRAGEPCRKCKTPIMHSRIGGRSTFFCPQCQPTIPT